jgi:hypothetical protein
MVCRHSWIQGIEKFEDKAGFTVLQMSIAIITVPRETGDSVTVTGATIKTANAMRTNKAPAFIFL